MSGALALYSAGGGFESCRGQGYELLGVITLKIDDFLFILLPLRCDFQQIRRTFFICDGHFRKFVSNDNFL